MKHGASLVENNTKGSFFKNRLLQHVGGQTFLQIWKYLLHGHNDDPMVSHSTIFSHYNNSSKYTHTFPIFNWLFFFVYWLVGVTYVFLVWVPCQMYEIFHFFQLLVWSVIHTHLLAFRVRKIASDSLAWPLHSQLREMGPVKGLCSYLVIHLR